jgi:hypothetical protein
MMDITISPQLIGLRTNWKENKWYSGYPELCTLFERKVRVIEFTAEVVLLSASGVLSPGPGLYLVVGNIL